jgi:1-acyl-sn-glycerol-3-phosphate acyltransferase
MGERVEHEIHKGCDKRDPKFITHILPLLDVEMAYYDAEVEGFEQLPAKGPMLIVANHSGGFYMPDYWAFLRHWVRVRGAEEPLHPLGFDGMFAVPGFADVSRRLGTVPASQENAARLLRSGSAVLVYPGGDQDDYRPWTHRHRIDLAGRTGFVRLALREQVPVIPMVSHGSHDVMIVLTRGDRLAHRLGLERMRLKVLPVVAGPPWGIAPAPLPTWPLPAKITVRVCEPMEWSRFGPVAANEPMIVRHCYEEILGRMQANLDEMAAAVPHPVMARLRDPFRHGSLARADRA